VIGTSSVAGSHGVRVDSPLLEVTGLRIQHRIHGQQRAIVSGIDLSLRSGEAIAIVGESGSGKSMTARALVRLLPNGVAAEGSVTYRGHNLLELSERSLGRLRGREIALLFQDPFTMLNPLLRCGRHIEETLRGERGRRRPKRQLKAEALRRLAEVEIADPGVADRYPFELSGGMRQRVALAAALAQNPRILIADEPTTALDVTTQREILALLTSLRASRGMSIVLITHDLRVAFSVCDRVYVLYAGVLLEVGPAEALEREPLHPYTLGLLLSEPPGDRRLSELVAITGSVAQPDEVATCCAFAPRCVWARPECRAGRPSLAEVASHRLTACIRIREIRPEMEALRQNAEQRAHMESPSRARAPLVRVAGVHKVFAGGVVALAGVSLEVGENESVGLVGESGSGKTTLARCLVGLETPTAGELVVDGVAATDYGALSESERRRMRRTIQIVFQDPYSSLNPVRTIGSTLKEALAVRGRESSELGEVQDLLALVGLPARYLRRKPAALSGGERQRVAIARALALEPRVIVCDEPVSALDVSVQAQILNLFQSLRARLGLSYLFITHDLAVVRQIVDRIYVLHRGAIVEAGPVDEVLDRPKHPYTVRLLESVPRSEADWLRAANAT
jgi:peptide/nickel transport system ATP-binding protein